MPRDSRAYLKDILDCCAAITGMLEGLEVFNSITHARRIVDFRNQLTHEYPSVNDDFVWGIAVRDVPILSRECWRLLTNMEANRGSF
jgi:uncharacterized protein with HEPN domain